MVAPRYYLGLDLGSVSLDAVVIDEDKRVQWHAYRKVRGRSWDAISSLCHEFQEAWIGTRKVKSFAGAMVTGSGKEIVQELLNIASVNEIIAHGTAASGLVTGKASVIEIGGQDSKFILVDDKGVYDYSMNELCAAGTGAFLDVQAERLGISIEELSTAAASAKSVPPMAGRCSVFAKSDIIHLQQRGIPVDQIVAGLCAALARNYVATLIRGRELVKPVIFQGGVALNDGVLRAFKDVLSLGDKDVLRPGMPHMAGAIGAAYLAMKGGTFLDAAVITKASEQHEKAKGTVKVGPTNGWQMAAAESASQLKRLEYFEVLGNIQPGEKLFLGLDIGSISTKAVVLSALNETLAKVYNLTAGQPLVAAQKVLASLAKIIRESDIQAVGVTGSGRKLVGHAIGADLVIDEITAQAKGAGHIRKVDTVIEIGGQDAKFISLAADSSVLDFEMNKACSAGTGSFVQEQAVRLGVDLKNEYSKLASRSRNPLPFMSRCTVFMESDLVHYIQQGSSLPDLLMGVSQAVVENYIDRVVQGRKLGKYIIIQGAVAKNKSVVKAFKARLNKSEITVHPHPGVSGAHGVAMLTREMFNQAGPERSFTKSCFKGLNFSINHQSSTFICKGCENRCEVGVFEFTGGRFYFGDLCGRYSEACKGVETGRDMTTAVAFSLNEQSTVQQSNTTVGIPNALLFHEFFPFWQKYFAEISIQTVMSGPSSNEKLGLALSKLQAETCLPVKLLFGHVASLVKEGIKTIFIPSISKLKEGVSCPNIQHAAAMIHANFDGINVLTLPLVPGLLGRDKERLTRQAAELFGLEKEVHKSAYDAASRHYEQFRQNAVYDIEAAGLRARPLAVLLGKPYNIGDRFVNMSLAAKLAKAGFDVISYEQLDIPKNFSLASRYNNITWDLSRRVLKAGIMISNYEDIYPVVIGNFGCGPDSFTFPLLQEIFASRPSLFLEFDEHRADAGLSTRVEAFTHRVAGWRLKKSQTGNTVPGEFGGSRVKRPKYSDDGTLEYIIPYFSDHALAFAGALEAKKNIKARVLPLPDHKSYETGVEFSGGKQCHPFQLIAGDLVKLARSGDLPRGARYIIPIIETSCMVSQYVPTIQQYMDKMGRGDVKVMGIDSSELFEKFGPIFVYNLGKAILAIEYLSRLRFEMRPYELKKGAIDQAYAAGLETIYQSQLEERVNQGIMEAARDLNAVPTVTRGTKPVIAITGDVYTRINAAANGGLFDLLESLGCEVWPSPTMVDVLMNGQEIRLRHDFEAGRPLDMLSTLGRVMVQNFGASSVIKNFEGRLANLSDPHAAELFKYTEGLLPGDPELLVLLNVAKHVDFANKGVDGILNVYCLNCFVGTATTSIFKRLAERTGGVPMMPMIFDTVGGTHVKNRVEAFVHRVIRNREEKLVRVVAKAADGNAVMNGHVGKFKEMFDLNHFPPFMKSNMKLPELKYPHVRLPGGLWGWKKKNGHDAK